MRKIRKTRRYLPVVLVVVVLGALALSSGAGAGAAVTWGSLNYGSPQTDWLWTGGEQNTDITTDPGGPTTYLHLDYSSDTNDAETQWAAYDCKPHTGQIHMGAYYGRSTDGGATWSTRFRLTDPNMHAERAVLAATGQYVHTAFVSQACYVYDNNGGWKFGNKPRVLYYRSNDNYGDDADWNPTIAMTSTSGRVDYPYLDAAGSTVLLTWTNANTGNVMMARSTDNGATFLTTKVGKTSVTYSYYGPEGYRSFPTVTIEPDGSHALFTYSKTKTKKGKGDLYGRISTDGGATWGAEFKIAGRKVLVNNAFPNSDSVNGRIGIVWGTGGKGWYREYDSGAATWGPNRNFWTAAAPYKGLEVANLALYGANQVGVSWGACKVAGCPFSNSNTMDLLWTETSDMGATWSTTETIQLANVTGTTIQLQLWPNIEWTDGTTRNVIWNDTNGGYAHYRLYTRTGTGTP